jgi:hypothetical protein
MANAREDGGDDDARRTYREAKADYERLVEQLTEGKLGADLDRLFELIVRMNEARSACEREQKSPVESASVRANG